MPNGAFDSQARWVWGPWFGISLSVCSAGWVARVSRATLAPPKKEQALAAHPNNKGKATGVTQPCVPVYFGDDEGYVVCTLAYGDDVSRVPSSVNVLVDVFSLKPRPGQMGVLYWSEDTLVRMRLEANDTGAPAAMPYDVSRFSKEFAALTTVQEANIGDFVALVAKVLAVEEKATPEGDFEKARPGTSAGCSTWRAGRSRRSHTP